MAGFFHRQRAGEQSPGSVSLVIANSETITVGGAVRMSSGYVAAATAGTKVLGICIGIVNKDGINLDNANTSTFDGTWTPGAYGTANYAAASDNATDKQVKAIVVYDKNTLWKNDAAGDLTAAQLMGFFNLSTATQMAAFVTGEVAGQFQLMQLDPDNEGNASQGLFKIAESVIDPYSQS